MNLASSYLRSWKVGLGISVVLLAVLAFSLLRSDEPTYSGARLSEWMLKLPKDHTATTAIQALGTNAIPFVLGWLNSEESPIAGQLRERALEAGWISAHSRWALSPATKQGCAINALQILGSQAGSAVPELRKVLRTMRGPMRDSLVRLFSRLGPRAKDAVPELLTLFNDPDVIRGNLAMTLVRIDPRTAAHPSVAAELARLGVAANGFQQGAAPNGGLAQPLDNSTGLRTGQAVGAAQSARGRDQEDRR
ncbi:MAG: hypothetical protein ACYDH9_16020 [Limisphaerales bacterium]